MNTDNFIHKLAEEAKPVKPLLPPMVRTVIWMGLTLAYFICLIFVLGVREDITQKLQEGAFIAELFLAISVGILAASTACYASLPDMNQQYWIRWIPFIPLGLLTVLLTYTHFFTTQNPMNSLVLQCMTTGYDCTWHILLFSIAPGIILFFMMRSAATIHAYWAGSMAVLAVTSFGFVAMRFLEANDDIAHILVWHYFPMLLMTAIGMWLGKAILRW